jgi:hypothetical protein
MNIRLRSEAQINPYMVFNREPHMIITNTTTGIHRENEYSFPFTTGISSSLKSQISVCGDKNLKNFGNDYDEYEAAVKSENQKSEEFGKAKKLAENSTKIKPQEAAKRIEQELALKQKEREEKEINIKQNIEYIRSKIDKFKQKDRIDDDHTQWQNWFNLFQMYRPNNIQNVIDAEPPPQNKKTADNALTNRTIDKEKTINLHQLKNKFEKLEKTINLQTIKVNQYEINKNKYKDDFKTKSHEFETLQEAGIKNNKSITDVTVNLWKEKIRNIEEYMKLAQIKYEAEEDVLQTLFKEYQVVKKQIHEIEKLKMKKSVSTTTEDDAEISTSEDDDDDDQNDNDGDVSTGDINHKENADRLIKQKIERINQKKEMERAEEERKKNILSKAYIPEHMSIQKEFLLYKKLLNFCKNLASQSKAMLYYSIQHFLRVQCVEYDLWKIGTSAVALQQNGGTPITPMKISHQIIRSFLHMHDTSSQAVIWAYLKYHYGMIEEYEAFTALIFAIQYEIKHHFHDSEVWDMAMMREMFKEYNIKHAGTQEDNWEKNKILIGIHHALVNLGIWVVLIEWIGDWKTFIKVWKYERGPLFPFIKHELGWSNTATEVSIQATQQKDVRNCFVCPHCNLMFNCVSQVTKHINNQIFGFETDPEFIDFNVKNDDEQENNSNDETDEVGKDETQTQDTTFEAGTDQGEIRETQTGDVAANTGKDAKNKRLNAITTHNVIKGILQTRDGCVKFIDSHKFWKQYTDDDFDTSKWRKIYTDPEIGKLINVGVDVVHCQDVILVNIRNFTRKLKDKMPEIQLNFKQNLEDNIARIEKQIEELQNVYIDPETQIELRKCRLALIELETHGSDTTDYTDNNFYLSFDPRRIEKAIELNVSLEEQGKLSFTFTSKEQEDIFHDNLRFFTITVFATLSKDTIKQVVKDYIDKICKKKIETAHIVQKTRSHAANFYVKLSSTSSTSDRLITLFDKFEQYGMLLWQKPVYGGFDNELLGKQLFIGNVTFSPVFTLIWNAWAENFELGHNLMTLENLNINENSIQQTNDTYIRYTFTGERPANFEKISDNITAEWKKMQSEFGGYKDSTTYMWMPNPSLYELSKMESMKEYEDILESRLFQCVSIILAHVGSEDAIHQLYNHVKQSIRSQSTESLHDTETFYHSIIFRMIMNWKLLNDYCTGSGNKERIINYTWEINSKSEMDDIDNFEYNLLRDNNKTFVRYVVYPKSDATKILRQRNQNLFERHMKLYPISSFSSMIQPERLTRKWWDIDNHDQLPEFERMLKFCKQLKTLWTEKSILKTYDTSEYMVETPTSIRDNITVSNIPDEEKNYINYMFLMTLQIHNVDWNLRCQVFNSDMGITQQYDLTSAIKISHELFNKLYESSHAHKSDNRSIRLEKYIKRDNMEPAEAEIIDNILIMGYDVYAAIIKNKEELENKLYTRHKDAKKQISFDDVKDVLRADTKHPAHFRSETRQFEAPPMYGFHQKETRSTRGRSKDKKKDYFKDQQRNEEKKQARAAKNKSGWGTFSANVYHIDFTRGRPLFRL